MTNFPAKTALLVDLILIGPALAYIASLNRPLLLREKAVLLGIAGIAITYNYNRYKSEGL